MVSQNLIAVVVIIVIIFLVLRFVAKMVAKVISLLVLGAVAVYLLFFWNGGVLDMGNKDFMLKELEQKYCVEQKDEAKCDCIIQPLKADIGEDKMEELKSNKLQSLRVMIKALKDNKSEIQECLKERKKEELWKEFIQELKGIDVKKELKETFDEVAETE